MTNKRIKVSVILLSWTFNNFNLSLKDDLTSCFQQEAVILLLGSVQIFATNQINFDKKIEL